MNDANASSSNDGTTRNPEGPKKTEQMEEDAEEAAKRLTAKRMLNAIHSRRKRERRRIEVEVLKEQSSDLTARNLDLSIRNNRLEELIDQAKRTAELYQKIPDHPAFRQPSVEATSGAHLLQQHQHQQFAGYLNTALRGKNVTQSILASNAALKKFSTNVGSEGGNRVDTKLLASLTSAQQREYYDRKYFQEVLASGMHQQQQELQVSETQTALASQLESYHQGEPDPLTFSGGLSAVPTNGTASLRLLQLQRQQQLQQLRQGQDSQQQLGSVDKQLLAASLRNSAAPPRNPAPLSATATATYLGAGAGSLAGLAVDFANADVRVIGNSLPDFSATLENQVLALLLQQQQEQRQQGQQQLVASLEWLLPQQLAGAVAQPQHPVAQALALLLQQRQQDQQAQSFGNSFPSSSMLAATNCIYNSGALSELLAQHPQVERMRNLDGSLPCSILPRPPPPNTANEQASQRPYDCNLRKRA